MARERFKIAEGADAAPRARSFRPPLFRLPSSSSTTRTEGISRGLVHPFGLADERQAREKEDRLGRGALFERLSGNTR